MNNDVKKGAYEISHIVIAILTLIVLAIKKIRR